MKRIAIPCMGDQVSAHFGHASEFVFYDVDPQNGQIAGEERLTAPPHEPGVLPGWIAEQKAHVVLVSGIGGRAQQLFAQHGIEVVPGISGGDPRAVAQAYLQGNLATSDNACTHDEQHGCH